MLAGEDLAMIPDLPLSDKDNDRNAEYCGDHSDLEESLDS